MPRPLRTPHTASSSPGPAGLLRRRDLLALVPLAAARAAAEPPLVQQWRQIAKETDGTVGAAALDFNSDFRASLNGPVRFPLASVCKVPIAMNMLALVDERKAYFDDLIEVLPDDVVTDVSPIAQRWPRERRFRLDEMLELMIAQSDNTAVQTLYRVGGGTVALAGRFRQWQTEGIRIDRSERQCGRDAHASMRRFLADPRDTATPDATAEFLRRAFRGQLLSPASTARLVRMMRATSTGAGRIKSLLPPATVVAHKTGTTATVGGINGSTNDVGVITFPGGAGQLAVAFYLKGSRRDLVARELIIARLAKAAFDACQ